MNRPVLRFALLLLALSVDACSHSSDVDSRATSSPAPAPALQIRTLSNRADLLSGGDAYVEIVLPENSSSDGLKIELDGHDLSAAFARRANGRVLGLVTGMDAGEHRLRATLADGRGAGLTLRNHPVGGPVFAGPQLQPWICGTEAAGLGPAQDAQCNAPPQLSYQYKSVLGVFAPYDPAHPAADVATITTDQGKTVPYIVRVETAAMDRGLYQTAILFDPATDAESAPWSPPAGWNGKLVWEFGGGVAQHRTQDAPGSALDDNALARGFAVGTGGLFVQGNNSNNVVSAEALMMAKERFVEQYGPIRYTIGQGCSGGSIQQQLAAAMYPGLLDGLMPSCSYPDVWSTAQVIGDCQLLTSYFNANPLLWGSPQQQAAVYGQPTTGSCPTSLAVLGSAIKPDSDACNLPQDQVYDAETNPTGARCTAWDYQASILGPRPPDVWSPVEQRLGYGFTRRPIANVGVQYGLQALLDGAISVEQFVDLNSKVGGLDIDGLPQPGRVVADPGSIGLIFRNGMVNSGRALARVPIIDLRGHDIAFFHTDDYSYVMRARLDQANGGHGNQVIFTGAYPILGDFAFACALGGTGSLGSASFVPPSLLALISTISVPACSANPLLLMDRWLAAIEADGSADPLELKVLRNKPAEAVDTCFVAGQAITDPAQCAQLYPHYPWTREVAGGPVTRDAVDCQLKPMDRGDYGSISFTNAQWATLQQAFPTGVCDYSKPSIDAQPALTWLSYENGPGGEPLGEAPVSEAFGP